MAELDKYYIDNSNKTVVSYLPGGSLGFIEVANEPKEMSLVFSYFSYRGDCYFRDNDGVLWPVMSKEMAEEFIPEMRLGKIDGKFKMLKRYNNLGLTKVL